MKPLKKAIFPVAGLGTRFLPATKSIPKEMLTVVDRPLIQYAVDEAVEAGIDTLIFVTGRSKRAIDDYFDRSPELEAELEAKGKTEALEIVRNVIPSHVKCFFVRQSHPLGLGHAVLCAADFIGDEPFAVLLPDDLIDGTPKGVMTQMLDIYRRTEKAVLAIEEVPLSEVHKYGVIKPKNQDQYPLEVAGIIEKPKAEDAPSNWSVVGRYILTPDVMEALKNQEPGTGGEIQLTDAIARCVSSGGFVGHPFHGRRFDCGSKRGFLEANMHYGLK
ncbi:UTP--glucose-1-phosphate uridylyltransferase GalU [Polynucleobacter sp. Tro8-14-1]|uniref:UTP--glucose-1-phosphate uridylyltransferase GalU n=1 Tax=Polynucleobacter sp. Tro8-14-1 TaxID=1758383 RepID=UPI001C0DB5A8|nr:UTP--glucose-1-phosphate uridylyltransferase GalU [Polynucleobacter sp. Tro8-14-1]MBU3563617.1 UTP--glucose-1-phosphate uridylyltransferase GalU [Polynucleobacter sp. Tro8-14-1]